MTKIKESGKISTPLEVTSQYVTEPTRKVSPIKKVTSQKNTEKTSKTSAPMDIKLQHVTKPPSKISTSKQVTLQDDTESTMKYLHYKMLL